MKIVRFLLIAALLSPIMSTSFARDPVVAPSYLSAAKLQGSGRLTWFGLHIYDAAFYRLGSSASPDFALNLRYQKSFSGSSITSRSVDEMKRIGISDSQATLWGKELNTFMPNVESGQTLTALYSPKEGTIFYFDGKQVGQIAGPEFSKAFFGIWLDPKTSAPKLRTELLGQTCPPPLFNEAC